jgi:hypothetical protein
MNGTGSSVRTASGRRSPGGRPHGAVGGRSEAVVGDGGRGPLCKAVTELDDMVELGRRRQASRQSLRSLVEQTDLVIAACERVHLAGAARVTEELSAQADALWTEARSVFAATAGWTTRQAVDRLASRRAVWIHQLMDALWSLQDETFNVLVPWRMQLDDNDEGERWSERIPA